MKMPRKELLSKLQSVAPALAENELVPSLTHLWFTGTEIVAFNDQIGASIPCVTGTKEEPGVTGGAPGKLLLALLSNSLARDTELVAEGSTLTVKAASSRFKLAMLPIEDAVFKMPKPKGLVLPIKEVRQFLDALSNCMKSVGTDTSRAEQLGITLVADGKSLRAYSTNNHTISHARIQLSEAIELKERVILSGSFCAQILRLAPGAKKIGLEINKDYALFTAGEVKVFGRLLAADRPIDFEAVIAEHYPAEVKNYRVPIPSKLAGILDRAIIVTEGTPAAENAVMNVTVKDNEMHFVSKTSRGEVTDRMQITEGHPDVAVKMGPRSLKAGYEPKEEMDIVVTKKAVIMTCGSMLYLVSTASAG